MNGQVDSRKPTVAYVADRSRLHHLLVSIASWRRFEAGSVCVVDIGLHAEGRGYVEAVSGGDVTFILPACVAPLPEHLSEDRRAYAFEQKTIVGSIVQSDPIVFLDSDILVVHPSFLRELAQVGENQLLAVPSAWDSDYWWTYTPASTPFLRTAIDREDFRMEDRICNSGVWAMRSHTAGAVAPRWHSMFRKALDSRELHETLRPGTQIGDQEFLVAAGRSCGAAWTRLHGSFNMQVHENRMPWSMGESGEVLCGHFFEPPAPVRAIHYGCNADGTVALGEGMIASPGIRTWIKDQYRTCWETVRAKLG